MPTNIAKSNIGKSSKTDRSDSRSSKKTSMAPDRGFGHSAGAQAGRAGARKFVIAGILALALAGGAAFFYTRWDRVASVNGEVITRQEYARELEKTAGRQVLEGLTTKRMLQQEARAKNVQVTNEEIDSEIKRLEEQLKSQGQSLEQVMALQGQSRDSLREQIVFQKTVEKLVGSDVRIASEEVDKYIEENPLFASDKNSSLTELRARAEDQLRQQKIDQKIQTFMQDLRRRATIEYYVKQ